MAAEDERLRREGNELFAKGDWQGAVAKYTECVDLLVRHDDVPADKLSLLLAAYSNRAQAKLNLGEHAAALADAEKAHLKSLLRKARALHGMKHFREAVTAYRSVLKQSPGLAEVEDSLKRALVADKQSRLGLFELEAWWNSEQQGTPPAIEDYVGPVEIRRAPGMGRGVFVTEDVAAGQLLFAVSPLVRIPLTGSFSNTECDELTAQLGRAISSAKSDVRSLPNLQLLVQVDALLGPRSGRSASYDCPRMRFFKPVNSLTAQEKCVSNADLRHPAVKKEFDRRALAKLLSTRTYAQMDKEVAVYPLASLLNHSCLPNTEYRYVQVGTVKMARASRDIKAGEQLFVSYADAFGPLAARRESFGGGVISLPNPFSCTCARCVFEEEMLEQVPALKALEQECTMRYRTPILKSEVTDVCVARVKKLEALLIENPVCRNLDEGRKNWIRASFGRLYRDMLQHSASLGGAGTSMESKLELRRLIHKGALAMSEVDPGSSTVMGLLALEMLVGRLKKQDADPRVIQLSDRLPRVIYGPGMKVETYAHVLFKSANIITPGTVTRNR